MEVQTLKKLKFPKVGLRNLKTGLAVFICMTSFQLLDRESAFFACIAAVVCMKDTIESSYSVGRNRLLGTFIGGIIGISLVSLIEYTPLTDGLKPLITSLGIILSIYIFTLWQRPAAVIISCIVILGIMCGYSSDESITYAIKRMIDTSFGVIIALLINKYITPPKKKVSK